MFADSEVPHLEMKKDRAQDNHTPFCKAPELRLWMLRQLGRRRIFGCPNIFVSHFSFWGSKDGHIFSIYFSVVIMVYLPLGLKIFLTKKVFPVLKRLSTDATVREPTSPWRLLSHSKVASDSLEEVHRREEAPVQPSATRTYVRSK